MIDSMGLTDFTVEPEFMDYGMEQLSFLNVATSRLFSNLTPVVAMVPLFLFFKAASLVLPFKPVKMLSNTFSGSLFFNYPI